MGFVKIHDAILNSSILEEDVIVRWVWICLLVSCDRNGNVYGTPKALARRANVSLVQFHKSLKVLMAPDKDSTSADEEGRRVTETGPNLFHCVNYQHYRGLKDPEEVREQARIRKQRQREREKAEAEAVTQKSHEVTENHDIAEAEAEAEADTEKTTSSSSSRKDDDDLIQFVLDFWKKEDLRPKVMSISQLRRRSILARKREGRELGSANVRLALENRANSRFLCFEIFGGKGAPIDWLFGPKNFAKVIDGNYNDLIGGTNGKGKGKSEYDDVL